MQTSHACVILREALTAVEPYPDPVVRVRRPLKRTGFFPGGHGLWLSSEVASLPPFPVGGIMILGQDFHSETEYEKSLARGYEDPDGATWRNLRNTLHEAQVDLSTCFFTNFFMGLRRGNVTTGRFPGASDRAFVGRCLAFLRKQIAAQRPRLILTLGIHVPRRLAAASDDLTDWQGVASFRVLDQRGALVRRARFADADFDYTTTVAALTHPSFSASNVWRRRYKHLTGRAAESRLLRDALVEAGVQALSPRDFG